MPERRIQIVRPQKYDECESCPLAGTQIIMASKKPGTMSIQILCG